MSSKWYIGLVLLLLAGSLQAQSVIVSRPPQTTDHDNGILTGESNRFGNFTSRVCADYFELEKDTTLSSVTIFGTDHPGTGFNGNNEGFSLHILRDLEGEPQGLPFLASGAFGSDGDVYFQHLQDDEIGSGFDYIFDGDFEDRVYFTIDFTEANDGEQIKLPAGGYWLAAINHVADDSIGSPVNEWHWQRGIGASDRTPMTVSWGLSSPDNLWQPLSSVSSFAWELSGIPDTLYGDMNMDCAVNLLDVQPFVNLLSSGGYQAEADINQDGSVDLLDVDPFVDVVLN
ncbi:MAG: dockerin type I domain-containing protein [Planctomycetota bacterium]